MKITAEKIIAVLKNIKYPGKSQNIFDLKIVTDIGIGDDTVELNLKFKQANDPFMNSIKKACEQSIQRQIDKNIEVTINISYPLPPNTNNPLLGNVKNTIAIASGKGGVGKSTVSVNLAIALAQTGAKVGLLDADIFGPSIPKMFGTEDVKPQMAKINDQNKIIPIEKYGVRILSIGYFVSPQDATIWRGAMATSAIKQFIQDAEWGELDYLLFDLPPGTSDIHLTLVQTVPLTGAIIVSTPQEVAIADAIKGISMFKNKNINVPILGIIENMSWFTPEELPEHKYYIFGKDGCKDLARENNVSLLGQIPIVQSIREGGDTGSPIILNNAEQENEAFRKLSNNVIHAVENRNKKTPPSKKVEMNK